MGRGVGVGVGPGVPRRGGPLLVLLLVLATAGLAVPGTAASTGSTGSTAGAPYVERREVLGRSARGRPIVATYRGDPEAHRVLLLLGQMHGDEKAGRRTARWVREHVRPRPGTGVWVIVSMNPDGDARGTRKNARGVDLNRNWPTSGWARSPRGSRYHGGPRPASEPETRAMMRFLRRARPDHIASLHQPLRGIGRHRGGVAWQRRLARNLDLPRRHFGVGNPRGTVSPTLTGWYNQRLRRHGVATTIEYGARPGPRYVTRRAGLGIARAARVR